MSYVSPKCGFLRSNDTKLHYIQISTSLSFAVHLQPLSFFKPHFFFGVLHSFHQPSALPCHIFPEGFCIQLVQQVGRLRFLRRGPSNIFLSLVYLNISSMLLSCCISQFLHLSLKIFFGPVFSFYGAHHLYCFLCIRSGLHSLCHDRTYHVLHILTFLSVDIYLFRSIYFLSKLQLSQV